MSGLFSSIGSLYGFDAMKRIAEIKKANDQKQSESAAQKVESGETILQKISEQDTDAFKTFFEVTALNGQVIASKTDKFETALSEALKNFTKDDENSAEATTGKVKENNSSPKAKFNGAVYDKRMTMTYKDGTKVVAYCDKDGKILGYNKVKYDENGKKTDKTSYTEEGKMSSKLTYTNGVRDTKETFDEQGRVISQALYSKKGKKSEEFYSYKEDGTKVTNKRNEYQRDADGKVTNKKVYKLDPETGELKLVSNVSYKTEQAKAAAPASGASNSKAKKKRAKILKLAPIEKKINSFKTKIKLKPGAPTRSHLLRA